MSIHAPDNLEYAVPVCEPPSSSNRIALPEAEIILYPQAIAKERADALFEQLRREVAWERRKGKLYGREYEVPRLQAWYGDSGVSYVYSGMKLVAEGWLAVLRELRDWLETVEPAGYNAVLANHYRDGNDGVGWHSDDEPGLGDEPVIASLSFGATRRFDLAHRERKDLKTSIDLTHGSLLLMKGSTQRCWRHQIPRQRKITSPRINLTFRVMK